MFQLVWTIWTSWKTKVDDSNVGKLKAYPADFTKLSDEVDNEVVKNNFLTTMHTLELKNLISQQKKILKKD